MVCNHSKTLKYWARINKNSNAEVDYVIKNNGEIIPIEVKYGVAGKLKSLHLLLHENPQFSKAMCIRKQNLVCLKKSIVFLFIMRVTYKIIILAAGISVIRIRDDDTGIATKKFMKQHF